MTAYPAGPGLSRERIARIRVHGKLHADEFRLVIAASDESAARTTRIPFSNPVPARKRRFRGAAAVIAGVVVTAALVIVAALGYVYISRWFKRIETGRGEMTRDS